MKTDRNILAAFVLNLAFAVFEMFGGLLTGSVAVLSDALHDLGDSMSIGVSWALEKKSKRPPDESHTYGYARYSVLGSILTTLILLVGSAVVILHAVSRIIHPAEVHTTGMMIFALVGISVNFVAAWCTRKGDSLNQKAVNLHMMEDVLGWAAVLVGAVVMHFTGFGLIDPLMSIAVAVFILIHAAKGLKAALDLFLMKTQEGMPADHVREHLMALDGVEDVHHLHLWSMDGVHGYATLHAVISGDAADVKKRIREEMRHLGVHHVTVEVESPGEICPERECQPLCTDAGHHHHHHHHHHHG